MEHHTAPLTVTTPVTHLLRSSRFAEAIDVSSGIGTLHLRCRGALQSVIQQTPTPPHSLLDNQKASWKLDKVVSRRPLSPIVGLTEESVDLRFGSGDVPHLKHTITPLECV